MVEYYLIHYDTFFSLSFAILSPFPVRLVAVYTKSGGKYGEKRKSVLMPSHDWLNKFLFRSKNVQFVFGLYTSARLCVRVLYSY